MRGTLRCCSLQHRQARRPILPLALVLVLVWVWLQHFFWLWFLARYQPNQTVLRNATDATGYWEIWHGSGQWGGTLQGCFMIINLLLVLYLWAFLRGLPRGTFADRCQQLLAYGGSAMLLMYLQHALLKASLLEPAYRVIRLPLTPFS
jgi:hypothetical protein